MFWIVMFLAQAAAVPSQTERGEALFLDASVRASNPDLPAIRELIPTAS